MLILDADSLKQAHITITLIFLNIFSFIIFNMFLPEDFLLLLVQINNNVIENLEIWRLFSAMFMHADVMHLFSNCAALLIFGAVIENTNSKPELLIIYFISGIIGNLFSLILLPLNSISLGASGCIFGLIGATFITFIQEDRSVLLFGLLYLGYFIVSSFSPGINLWAHLFGLLGGIIFGYIFRRKKREIDYY